MSINAAKTMVSTSSFWYTLLMITFCMQSLNSQTSKEDDEHPNMRHSESDDISSSNVGGNIEQEETLAEVRLN